MTLRLPFALLAALPLALAQPAAAQAVRPATPVLRIEHLPPSECPVGVPLTLTAKVENPQLLANFDLHYRKPGGKWVDLPFGKDARGNWAVIIAADEVQPPSLEYYLTSRELTHDEVERFASAALPHPVLVRGEPGDLERQGRLAYHHGHTSSAQVNAEYVSFGSTQGLADRYYLLEGSYEYRLLGFVQHIRLGVGTLRGEVPPPTAFGSAQTTDPIRQTGLDYGYGELAFNLADQVGFTTRMILGADELGFSTGFAGTLRIGRETFAHVELGAQFIQRFGYDVALRLAWDTVPRWPLGFAIHVTNTPNAPVAPGSTPDQPITDGGAPTGIRALVDAGFEATTNVTLLMKVGYQARASVAGGATVGLGAQVEW